ncbi:unnamed protein product [Acanthoscelides obtectus]|uniref:asparaginase n=2 Tax=Acanthoscelides obtectus TaxID=200917 RepID=A0A9P0PTN7_ACAOB|nr:unnamed protein product [Acanthoscelides obtectus]CAK1686773.1 hypothetical protein AOBTE_LOCUS36064 [Acanthoscelides obtectus]
MFQKLKKVLVIYVGGTIGMQKNDDGVYSPVANTFLHKVKYHSEMHDADLAKQYFPHLKENELVLPVDSKTMILTIYEIVEYVPLLDSSNMGCKEWIRIAKDIERYYESYDGFIILHGTDTLAFTASALSFMLEGLRKPVIVTGSQIPIFETRSDAKDNFLSSLILASYGRVPEVCVFFASKLYRGNRVTKMSSDELEAFGSPNYNTLADVGIDVKFNDHYIRQVSPTRYFAPIIDLNPNVGILAFFPTMTCNMVNDHCLEAFLQPPVQGLVIQTYGAGNLPSSRKDLMDVLRNAVKRRILIVNVTQCSRGTVQADYETGKVLQDMGIILGADMTAEAAYTKLIFVLGLPELSFETRVKLMKSDLRGEMTVNSKCSCR